jgi:hypothetical protein
LQVHQEFCKYSNAFDKPFEKIIQTYEWDEICNDAFETTFW